MSQETSVQPNLNELFAGYLARQADAQAAGIASFDSEVTPYEVGPVQPLDPKMAWDEALAALALVGESAAQRRKAPGLVLLHSPLPDALADPACAAGEKGGQHIDDR